MCESCTAEWAKIADIGFGAGPCFRVGGVVYRERPVLVGQSRLDQGASGHVHDCLVSSLGLSILLWSVRNSTVVLDVLL